MNPIILSQISKHELVQEITSAVCEGLKNQINKPLLEGLLTCEQVEVHFQISHQTRIEWTRTGILPKSLRVGRRVYYRTCDIQAVPVEMLPRH